MRLSLTQYCVTLERAENNSENEEMRNHLARKRKREKTYDRRGVDSSFLISSFPKLDCLLPKTR